jgi:hypothetical protein
MALTPQPIHAAWPNPYTPPPVLSRREQKWIAARARREGRIAARTERREARLARRAEGSRQRGESTWFRRPPEEVPAYIMKRKWRRMKKGKGPKLAPWAPAGPPVLSQTAYNQSGLGY